MTITLPLQPQEEARLVAAAEARGITTDELVREALDRLLTAQDAPGCLPLRTVADIVLESMSGVTPEVMATMPHDGASEHDHYIYGWPKREA